MFTYSSIALSSIHIYETRVIAKLAVFWTKLFNTDREEEEVLEDKENYAVSEDGRGSWTNPWSEENKTGIVGMK
jgi:hypothetical protein